MKLIVLSGFFVFITFAFCQNFDLNINFSDGTTISFPVDEIQRIEFENVTNNDDDNIQFGTQNTIIMQNYPNPFNPSTIIEYSIPKTAKVNVSIFNIKGQLINELINDTQTDGTHQIIWNSTNSNKKSVSSGIYFCIIRSNNLTQSKKMLLLK
jgi:hypothetical protein